MDRKIEIEEHVTVSALADHLSIPVTKLVAELFKNGIMATVNEKIDIDTAQIIVKELAIDVELVKKENKLVEQVRKRPENSSKATKRPPVIAVMGHVDHGKTSLLDAIRGADVVKGEAGGITQHISAYQITHNDNKITFLDTPGHEAFAALREHGAKLTDMAIIVVAADDGIKPQTLEAIRFARKAGVKMIIAVNKMDKTGADINRLKQQLSENELMPEEWGGDTVILPISAKTGEGVKELLDMIVLVSDIEELKADYDVPGSGLIIEAHMEQGRGSVAVALVEHGVLRPGNFVVAGSTYAKIRNLETTTGGVLKEAGPSTPVIMTGFKVLPEFADEFVVVGSEKEARQKSAAYATEKEHTGTLDMTSSELIRMINRNNQTQEVNVIIKADVQGSLTSVLDSLKTLDTDEVALRIVGSGVGAISENDTRLATTTKAIIYGFHVEVPSSVKQQANRDKVDVRLFKVIYELIDDARLELEKNLAPEIIEESLGRLLVRGVFKITKQEIICGGEVTKGRLAVPSLAKLFRGDELLSEVEVVALKHGPQEAREVLEGEMCGVSFKPLSKTDVQEGDRLEFFTRTTKERKL